MQSRKGLHFYLATTFDNDIQLLKLRTAIQNRTGMATIVSTFAGVKKEHEIPDNGGLRVIVAQPGIRVDVPSYVEIDSRTSQDCLRELKQIQWEWMSKGQLFQVLFHIAFADTADGVISVPKTVEELVTSDYGIQNICGMIILGCEACFAKQNIFIRNPEDGLHPQTTRRVVQMLYAMLEMCGASGKVATKTAEKDEDEGDVYEDKHSAIKDLIKKTVKKLFPEPQESQTDRDIILNMLKLKQAAGGNEILAKYGDNEYTIDVLIQNIEADTPLGRTIVKAIIESFKNGVK